MTRSAPAVLITATTPWPLSARLAMSMIAHGCRVTALCPPGHALNELTKMGAIYSDWRTGPQSALERAIMDSQPDIVVPCDDRAVWQLHELHENRPPLRELIEKSIGAPEYYPTIDSRIDVLKKARDMRIDVPDFSAIHSEDDIEAWFRAFAGKAVVKLDGTWGGSGVAIVDSYKEAVSAWRAFKTPQRAGTAWKRWLINRDPLAFWSQSRARACNISLQRFIPGRSANAMAACWQGTVLGLVSVEVLCTQGHTGSSTIVRLVEHQGIGRAVRALVEGLALSGFCGLDFILEQGTEVPHLLELNPRCTQLGHLALPGQGDLAGLLCEKLGGRAAASAAAVVDKSIIAFFPHALAWNPDSPYMQQSYHDVPWSEPALVRELLQEPWAERQWPARLYHWIRGKAPQPVPSPQSFFRLAAEYGFSSERSEHFTK